MNFLSNFISIIESYFSSGLASYYLYPMLCLGFLCTVPFILRYFFRR